MTNYTEIMQRRRAILDELKGMERIRRGSVVEQYLTSTTRDGRRAKRGPYALYTLKRKGRTVSRRLRPGVVAVFREQIAAGRRFQDLVHELMELGEVLSDQTVQDAVEKKTPSI
jgi:cell division protein YceG involved in septum cleavage